MKKHHIWVYAALGVSIALIVVACTITPKYGPDVSIHETFIEIYPGTKISSADEKALDAVLKKFNKSLYQIRTYDQGRLVKTRGSLADARIPHALVAEVNRAAQKGVSDSALKIGLGEGWLTYTKKNPSPVAPPTFAVHPAPSPKELEDSERLVSRVRPILQKYSYDQVGNVVNSGNR